MWMQPYCLSLKRLGVAPESPRGDSGSKVKDQDRPGTAQPFALDSCAVPGDYCRDWRPSSGQLLGSGGHHQRKDGEGQKRELRLPCRAAPCPLAGTGKLQSDFSIPPSAPPGKP